jgi:hypothetical protein
VEYLGIGSVEAKGIAGRGTYAFNP